MKGRITVRKEARGPALIAISALWAAAAWCATCEQSSAQPNAATAAVTAPGRIEAASRMLIGTAGNGTIAELPVREGARVQAGQLLARLDCTNLEKELQGKTSALAASEAILARVMATRRNRQRSCRGCPRAGARRGGGNLVAQAGALGRHIGDASPARSIEAGRKN